MTTELPPYPEYKASGVPWLGDVPAHWQVLPNRSVFSETNSRNLIDEAMLSVTIANGVVLQRSILEDSSKKDSSREDKSTYKLVEPGDIAYNKMRAWQGAIGVSEYRGIVSPAYVVQRPRSQANSRYLHYLLRTPAFANEAERWSYGITSDMWSLRSEHFKMIYCCLPPLDEQQAIVRYLDHIDRRVRRYIRAKQRLLALLREQKQAIIHQAVTRGLDASAPLKPSGVAWLGEVPAHWEVKRLKWVTHLQRGYDLSQEQRLPGVVPVVSSGGIIGTHNQARVSSPGVVMGRYGSTDAIYYLEQDFWPHNTALFVTDFYGNDVRWCFHLLSSISKADHAAKSAVPGVDRKDLHDIVVVCPPHDEQVQIAANIDIVLSDLDNNVDRVNKQIDLIREYRTRLIADVVTGKVDVRAAAAALPAEVGEEAAWATGEVEEENEEVGEEELQRMETGNG